MGCATAGSSHQHFSAECVLAPSSRLVQPAVAATMHHERGMADLTVVLAAVHRCTSLQTGCATAAVRTHRWAQLVIVACHPSTVQKPAAAAAAAEVATG
jgi:hypothetical protein